MSKKKSWLLYISFFGLFVGAIVLGFLVSGNSKNKQEKDSISGEKQFEKLKTKQEEILWDDLLIKAQEDCKSQDTFKSQEEKNEYFYNISKEMLEELDVERDIALIFNLKRVPRTFSCYAIWMGNDEGAGFGGYKTLSGELATYSINFSKESLKKTFNR